MDNNQRDICESLGWVVDEGEHDLEFRQESPLGEDYFFTVPKEHWVENVADYAHDFDPDEHAALWIPLRGTRGVPHSIADLIKDARDIKQMLDTLATKLEEEQGLKPNVITVGTDWKWQDIEAQTGYKPITDFYEQLAKIEPQGAEPTKKAFDKIFADEKAAFAKSQDPARLTELALVANWKMWDFSTNRNTIGLALLYEVLWRKIGKYCLDNFKGESLSYYLRTVD